MNVLMQMSEMSISKLQFGYGFTACGPFSGKSHVFSIHCQDFFKEYIHFGSTPWCSTIKKYGSTVCTP